jgi:hypothetical protein
VPRGSAGDRPAKTAERAAVRAEQTGEQPPKAAGRAARAEQPPKAAGRAARAEQPAKAAPRAAVGAQSSNGDPVGGAIRTAAKLAGTGARVAGTVTQEILRRIPRP